MLVEIMLTNENNSDVKKRSMVGDLFLREAADATQTINLLKTYESVYVELQYYDADLVDSLVGFGVQKIVTSRTIAEEALVDWSPSLFLVETSFLELEFIKDDQQWGGYFIKASPADSMYSVDQTITLVQAFQKRMAVRKMVFLEVTREQLPYTPSKLARDAGLALVLPQSLSWEDLVEFTLSYIDFGKSGGLVPTVVQSRNKEVLMVAYSSRDSLKVALEEGRGIYWSRSRQELWRKGATSGNTQILVKARFDCDADSLLFLVEQEGWACHLPQDGCFGESAFSIPALLGVIKGRMSNTTPGSYTRKLLTDSKMLGQKILEEAEEVVGFTDFDNLVWELADLSYFLLVLMAKERVEPIFVINQLRKRRLKNKKYQRE